MTKLRAAANHYGHDVSGNIEAEPQGVIALDPSLVAVWEPAAPLLVCATMTPFDRALLTIPPRTVRRLSSSDAYGVTGENVTSEGTNSALCGHSPANFVSR